MAISLAFGVVFATVITLVMVPALYLISEDLFSWGALDREARLAAHDRADADREAAAAAGGS